MILKLFKKKYKDADYFKRMFDEELLYENDKRYMKESQKRNGERYKKRQRRMHGRFNSWLLEKIESKGGDNYV